MNKYENCKSLKVKILKYSLEKMWDGWKGAVPVKKFDFQLGDTD